MITQGTLLGECKKLGLNGEHIFALLRYLVAPRDLRAMGTAIRQIYILSKLGLAAGLDLGITSELQSVLSTTRSLMANSIALQRALPESWTGPLSYDVNGIHPLSGESLQASAFWGTLYGVPTERADRHAYLFLTSIFLAATIKAAVSSSNSKQYGAYVSCNRTTPLGEWASAFAGAGLAIRHLTSSEFRPLLLDLGRHRDALSLTDHCASLLITKAQGSQEVTRVIAPLGSFMRLALGKRTSRASRGYSRDRHLKDFYISGTTVTSTDQDPDGHVILKTVSSVPESPSALIEDNLHPEELSYRRLTIGALSSDIPPDLLKKLRKHSAQLSYVINSTLISNFSAQDLSPHEVAELKDFTLPRSESRATAAIRAAVAVSFWLGRHLDEATTARFTTSDQEPLASIEYCLDIAAWRIQCIQPHLVNAATEEEIAASRSVTSHILIADCFDFNRHLDNFCPVSARQPSTFIFPISTERTILSRVRDLFSKNFVLKQITPQKVVRPMHVAIMNASPFWAILSLLTGTIRAQSHVALHYFSPLAKDVAEVYIKAAQSLGALASIECEHQSLDVAVGSLRCPLKSTLVQHVHSLYEAHRIATSDVDKHNTFARISHFTISFALALRALRDHNIDHFDPMSGLMIYSDKDNATNFHRRVLVVAPAGLQQLIAWRDYRTLLKEATPRLRSASRDQLPFFFQFDRLGRTAPLIPSELRKGPLALPLPINSLRRYISTRMWELGATGEEIGIVLGHWSPGREPFSSYSALDMPALKSITERFMVPLLDEIGMRLIHPPKLSGDL